MKFHVIQILIGLMMFSAGCVSSEAMPGIDDRLPPRVFAARDAEIGEIADPEAVPDLYQTVSGFFSAERESYTDPAMRSVLAYSDCMLEEVIEVRIAAVPQLSGPVEIPARLVFFSRQSMVVTVVIGRDDRAPAGWYVLDWFQRS